MNVEITPLLQCDLKKKKVTQAQNNSGSSESQDPVSPSARILLQLELSFEQDVQHEFKRTTLVGVTPCKMVSSA